MIKLLIFYLAQVAQLVEQATENRCVGGSIPPLGTTMRMLIVNKILIISLTLFLMGCDSSSKNDYFPDDQGIIWHYKISIGSDYTGKIEEKRLTISNSNRRINAKGTSYSKVFSNGNSFTFLKDVKNNSFTRISASITNGTGLEEPVKKVIFPSIYFESKDWKTLSQLLITKGFQPPLRDFKPSKVFEMNFKVSQVKVLPSCTAETFLYNEAISLFSKYRLNFLLGLALPQLHRFS